MKPTLKIEVSEDGAKIALFQGDLTIRFLADLRSHFGGLDTETCDMIIVDHPDAIGLCFIQMLWEYTKESRRTGKKINLSFSLNESDHRLLTKTGILSRLPQY